MKNPLYVHKIDELKIDPKYWKDEWNSMDETVDHGQIAFMSGTWKWIQYCDRWNVFCFELILKQRKQS